MTDSSVRTEPVTTTVTSEAEAIFYMTRHAQAYADLNQGPGTSGLAIGFLLAVQVAVTKLLQLQQHRKAVSEAVANQRVIDVLVQENTDLAEPTK